MKKYFTKEYIKECNCKKIQELKIKSEHGWKLGDWYTRPTFGKRLYLVIEDIGWRTNDEIWLPTGDQLDEEIVKICIEKQYRIYPEIGIGKPTCYRFTVTFKNEKVAYSLSNNPLIAKIKLLKELLNE